MGEHAERIALIRAIFQGEIDQADYDHELGTMRWLRHLEMRVRIAAGDEGTPVADYLEACAREGDDVFPGVYEAERPLVISPEDTLVAPEGVTLLIP